MSNELVDEALLEGFGNNSPELRDLAALEAKLYREGDLNAAGVIRVAVDYLYIHGIMETRYSPPRNCYYQG